MIYVLSWDMDKVQRKDSFYCNIKVKFKKAMLL